MSTEKNYEGPCFLTLGLTSKLQGAILINSTKPIVSWRDYNHSLPAGLPRLTLRDTQGNVAFSFALDVFYAEQVDLRMKNTDDDRLWFHFKFLHPHQHFSFRYDFNGVGDYISALALSTIWPSRTYHLEVGEPYQPGAEDKLQRGSCQAGERVQVTTVPIELITPSSMSKIQFRFPSIRGGLSFSS
ncbi:uncharacterized protein A1O5_08212 [Cladophialophora psammophila CBS 110553]|uniref:Uncharacterized protein n=1 Tax=Cladophialophora psammophila CBS 110553 TaxID=1182543 RepID=W9WTS9_9EURO|nr:uncharacterized protein A1O5_08212 [Cladophialophora psammophila CBS 110553]EXJ68420.1 hypothetical protein A1O5_08212 [Cladophialophora psammophila CBS 110553]